MSASTTPERDAAATVRWILGIAATVTGGLIVGGWTSISTQVNKLSERVSAAEATSRIVESRLDRMEGKIDKLLERK